MTHLHSLPDGYQLDEYRIESTIGGGGFGLVYAATDTSLQSRVVIKEYHPGAFALRGTDRASVQAKSAGDEDNYRWGLERFLKEAQLLRSLRHPNVVQVYRLLSANNTAYMVMEDEGRCSLSVTLEGGKTLSEDKVTALLEPLLSALETVHARGILHCDLKPENILIRPDESPVLIDFGAAKRHLVRHSRSADAMVSPPYAPLEQYDSGSELAPSADIYALGAVLYECVTGQLIPEAPGRLLNDRLEPLVGRLAGAYSSELLRAIDSALRLRPEDRPADVAAFRALLRPSKPGRPPLAPKRGEDLLLPLQVTLEEVAHGTERDMCAERLTRCPMCVGTGVDPNGPALACGECQGAGRIRQSFAVRVKVPLGVDTGDRIRLAGEGDAGKGLGGESGDLYVEITVAPHSLIRRDGGDLYIDCSVDAATARDGGKIELPLLGRRLLVEVPPGSRSTRTLKLAGQGIQRRPGNEARGDLYCKISPVGMDEARGRDHTTPDVSQASNSPGSASASDEWRARQTKGAAAEPLEQVSGAQGEVARVHSIFLLVLGSLIPIAGLAFAIGGSVLNFLPRSMGLPRPEPQLLYIGGFGVASVGWGLAFIYEKLLAASPTLRRRVWVVIAALIPVLLVGAILESGILLDEQRTPQSAKDQFYVTCLIDPDSTLSDAKLKACECMRDEIATHYGIGPDDEIWALHRELIDPKTSDQRTNEIVERVPGIDDVSYYIAEGCVAKYPQ